MRICEKCGGVKNGDRNVGEIPCCCRTEPRKCDDCKSDSCTVQAYANDVALCDSCLVKRQNAQALLKIQDFINENGYLAPRFLPDGRLACVMPLAYTGAIIVMNAQTYRQCYDDRWCYQSVKSATDALDNWENAGGTGEPVGWHRHPRTGRRRPDGDASKEYINL